MLVDGVRQWVTYQDLDYDESDFVALADSFIAAGGEQLRTELGTGRGAVVSHEIHRRLRHPLDHGQPLLARISQVRETIVER